MLKIKKGDVVFINKGKDKGKVGSVLLIKTLRKQSLRRKVIVSGLNLVKKCTKSDHSKNKKGCIIEKEAFLESSNLSLVYKEKGKKSRIGFGYTTDGKKCRVFKKSKEIVI